MGRYSIHPKLISWALLISTLGSTSAKLYNTTREVESAISAISSDIRRCCSDENTLHGEKINAANGKLNQRLTCNTTGNEESGIPANVALDGNKGECTDGKFQSFTFGTVNNNRGITYIVVDSTTNELRVKNLPSQRISIPISSTDYCVGVESVITENCPEDDSEEINEEACESLARFQPVLKYCPKPCGGKEPCIRTCLCGRGMMYSDKNGTCTEMSEEVKKQLSDTDTKKKHEDESGGQDEALWLGVLQNEQLSKREKVFEIGMKLTEENFDLVNEWRRGCRQGNETNFLEPSQSCKDQFTIGTTCFNHGWCGSNVVKNPKNSDISLHIHEVHIFDSNSYPIDEFCINIKSDGETNASFGAEVCKKTVEQSKFKFYPAILAISCFFLLATVFIYTRYEGLLNHYTRIMRHFAISMFFAFFVLIVNQSTDFVQDSPGFCKVLAVLQLYWFLTAFNLMTVMSVETYLHLRRCIKNNTTMQLIQHLITPTIDFLKGFDFLVQQNKTSDSLLQYSLFGTYQNKSMAKDKIRNHKKYRIEVVCCYCLSAIWTIFVLIAEVASPKCAPYQPRFGEVKCFFANRVSKITWFYLPIALLLLINLIMFVITSIELCRLDYHVRKRRKLQLEVQGTRREMMERFLVFIKLSFGMGLIWSMEIVSGVLDVDGDESKWYFTDILNMLQGVFVFLIFVCKRNVYEVMFGRKQEGQNAGKEKGVEMSGRVGNGESEETEALT